MQQPSSFLQRMTTWLVHHATFVIIAAVIATVMAAVVGVGGMERFSLARFQADGSESMQAANILEEEFNTGTPNVTVVVQAKDGNIDSPTSRQYGEKLAADLAAHPEVTEVSSYWGRNNSPVLRSQDGAHALIIARIAGDATEAREALTTISPQFTVDNEAISTKVGGRDEVFRQVGAQARQDFVRAELLILPAMALLLYWVYRRFVAAFVTLGLGIFAVFSTLAILTLLLPFIEISTFASNLTLVMGLGLALDYSLLIIARFREELRAGHSVPQAVTIAGAIAGRTVIFSGLTVAIALLALLLFPFPFLQSFAYAGMSVVLTSIIGAVVILPAALALLGKRIEQRNPPKSSNTDTGRWYRSALVIMSRPVLYGGLALVLILVLASPVLRLQFGLPDDRILPAQATSRQAQQVVRDNFTAEQADAFLIAADVNNPEQQTAAVAQYAQTLSKVPGIAQVDTFTGSYIKGEQSPEHHGENINFIGTGRVWLMATPESQRLANDSAGLVHDVRTAPAPFATLVGGETAEVTDFRTALLSRLPWVLATILAITFVLLFLMTGSIVLPLIATVLNSLSIAVMGGALVWVFQEGNAADLLNFTATGFIEPSIPILMLCVAYGLSMDYQVFILSRIKEIYEQTGDTTRAIAVGLQRTAPLIVAAASILAFTFAMYVTSDVTQLKMLAVGMAVAVFIDATIIRLILLPAAMKLMSRSIWWLPSGLRRFYNRFQIREQA